MSSGHGSGPTSETTMRSDPSGPVQHHVRERQDQGAHGIDHEPVETYGNGVRKVEYHDPDGNQFGIGGGPE